MPPSNTQLELAPDYYLHNFERLVGHVQRLYPTLLNRRETSFLGRFQHASTDGRRLFVRLAVRRSVLFRADRLKYPELQSLSASIDELSRLGLLAVGPADDSASYCRLLTRQELITLLRLPDCRQWRRARLEEALQDQLAGARPELPCLVLRPEYLDVVATLQAIYFGNFQQSLTDFVLTDLGIQRYERYLLTGEERQFTDRCELDYWLGLYDLDGLARQAISEGDLVMLQSLVRSLGEPPAAPWLRRRHDRILLRIGYYLERRADAWEALDIYRLCGMHPARERIYRILVARRQLADAVRFGAQLLSAPLCDLEREVIEGLQKKTEARLAGRTLARPKRSACWPEDHLRLDLVGPVEARVAEHFQSLRGGRCVHVENSLLRSLFGLVFWKAIFAPLPGAFFNPYQTRPADLHAEDFAANRKDLIGCLGRAVLEGQFGVKALHQAYADKQGLANPFVDWRLNAAFLADGWMAIGNSHLHAVFTRMWQDMKRNCSGFPDLFWLGVQGDYEFIEVKGPGDRLQKHQSRWLSFFVEQGIPCRVVYVSR